MTVADIYRIYGQNTGGLILIGGLDPTKFQDVEGFNNYFRASYDPSRPEVIPLANITEYNAVLNADGYLDVTMRVNTLFEIPSNVLSNYNTGNLGSQITYYIDVEGYTQGLGGRSFANQFQMNHFYVKGLKELGSQWNVSVSIDYLDFESLEVLGDYYFHNMRFGMERLNIRNASILEAGQDPSSDTVFNNFKLNQSNKRNVIYAHPNMATINNGGVLNTLQQAINRGVDVRFVSDQTNIPATVSDLTFEVVGGTYVKLAFTDIVDADFYEVWLKDYSDPDNVILRYFLYSEITNADKYVSGLKTNTKYDIRVKAVDVNYNKGEFSDWEQVDTEAQDAAVITQSNVGGTYIEMIIDNYAVLDQTYNITNIEVYVDNVLNQTIAPTDKPLASNLTELTNYDVSVKIITDTITLSSNTLTATTMQIPALFQNAVSYYKLDEVQGDALDSISGHNGTLHGDVQQGVQGKIGNAYKFTNGRVDLPMSIYNDFNLTNFVISFWVKLENTSGVKVIMGQNATDIDKRNIFILQRNDTIEIQAEDNSSRVIIGSQSLIADTWYFLQFKSDFNSSLELKLNNISQGVHNYVNPTAYQDSISIGDRTVSSSLPFEGEIDELPFINGQTSNGQDSELYNNGLGTTI